MSTTKIRWDEENLANNEVIKQQLNPQRIDEPKTPYVHTVEPDDDADGGPISPVSIDNHDERPNHLVLCDPEANSELYTTMFALGRPSTDSNVGISPRGSSPERSYPRQVSFEDERSAAPALPSLQPTRVSRVSPWPEDDCAELHQGDQQHNQGFASQRKQHYNMREALKRGRQLAADNDEEEEQHKVSKEGNGVADGGDQQAMVLQ